MPLEVETDRRRATGWAAKSAGLGENYRKLSVQAIWFKKTYP
jgi:hypothetical protein